MWPDNHEITGDLIKSIVGVRDISTDEHTDEASHSVISSTNCSSIGFQWIFRLNLI